MKINLKLVLIVVAGMSSAASAPYQIAPASAVVDAELEFARLSRQTNTVNAFVTFLAEDAVLFQNGIPTNGKQLWQSRKPDSTLLNWWPVSADIAARGDVGYTTGPYQFFSRRGDRVPVDNGYYSTIWKKQKNGEWKIKIDIGVSFSSIRELSTELVYAKNSVHHKPVKGEIVMFDSTYNVLISSGSKSFDATFLASQFRIHRHLIGPVINSTSEIEKAEFGNKFKFEQVGGEEAAGRDLAYTYGNVTMVSHDGEKKSNYLRVWKNEGGQWKIVLDVVTGG